MTSVNSTSPSAIRPCDGGKRSFDSRGEQNESDNFTSACVAESRQALRPASFQSFARFPSCAVSELASIVVDRPMALRPNGLSTIIFADHFSQSTECLRPDGSKPLPRQRRYGHCPSLWLRDRLVIEIEVQVSV